MTNISTRAEQLRLNHVFSIFNDTCPNYMEENFTKIANVHHYNTRGSNFNFQIPKVKTADSHSFLYNAIHNWNRLPDDIKSCGFKHVYKKKCKAYLLDRMDV